jgi:hypothetical protein
MPWRSIQINFATDRLSEVGREIKFQRTHPVVFINFSLYPSKHNTNEICIITFNGALLMFRLLGAIIRQNTINLFQTIELHVT